MLALGAARVVDEVWHGVGVYAYGYILCNGNHVISVVGRQCSSAWRVGAGFAFLRLLDSKLGVRSVVVIVLAYLFPV